MQKSKLNSNVVGANCVRPHFKELTLKKQKGITLIALIITIIVMLILVGVTVNVALNGGLFEKAETATKGTEEKAILEEMLAMMIIDDNGKFKPDEIIANMKAKHPEYQIDDSNKPNITITGKLGTYKYIVSETEIKIGSKEIKKFDWKDVGLTVDIDTDYKFYDPNTSTTYMINFTADGKLIVKADGTTVETYDATEEDDGILTIPFTYAGNVYDTTLTMNSNNIDVDAELKDFTTVTYTKVEEKTYPVVYSDPNGSMSIIEISPIEAIVYAPAIGATKKVNIYECSDLRAIPGYENYTLTNNSNITYTKMISNSSTELGPVYSELKDKWYMVAIDSGRKNIGIADEISDYTYIYERNTTMTKAEIDSIIQSANATSE